MSAITKSMLVGGLALAGSINLGFWHMTLDHQVVPPEAAPPTVTPAQNAISTVTSSSPITSSTPVTCQNTGGAIFCSYGGTVYANGTINAPPTEAEHYVFAGLLPYEASHDKALRLGVRRWVMTLPEGKPRTAYLYALEEYDRNDDLLDKEHAAQQAAEATAKEAPQPDCKRVADDFVCTTKRGK